ncbi:hypothetical protein MAAFP003_2240 [Mycobacterium ahvazicum]|uniref:Uncharacterized protein n=1 Tax=Mycobacterium ahvazicum TaxID=1964395 RepID=A0A2K4Y9U1_9MYCO|nr:hypothetical protein [Mycobacterium ahvazicum]SOX53566.1 hypothetical protein MAAFP003_2240 [Mycobacterium ahvazicum]
MTSDDSHAGAPARRFSTAALVAAGLAGLIVGAIAAFAITGLVFTIRVQLPPPPYPPPFSSQTPGYPAPPAPTGVAPAPSVVPMPPLPPGPHAQPSSTPLEPALPQP